AVDDLRRHHVAAAGPQPAGRDPPRRRRHVHHRVLGRGDRSDPLRRVLGPDRNTVDRIHPGLPLRADLDDVRLLPEFAPTRRDTGLNMAAKPGLSDATIAKLLLIALSFCWGLSWTAMRVALDEVSPWTLRLIGYSIGAMTLFVLLKAQGRKLTIPFGK